MTSSMMLDTHPTPSKNAMRSLPPLETRNLQSTNSRLIRTNPRHLSSSLNSSSFIQHDSTMTRTATTDDFNSDQMIQTDESPITVSTDALLIDNNSMNGVEDRLVGSSEEPTIMSSPISHPEELENQTSHDETEASHGSPVRSMSSSLNTTPIAVRAVMEANSVSPFLFPTPSEMTFNQTMEITNHANPMDESTDDDVGNQMEDTNGNVNAATDVLSAIQEDSNSTDMNQADLPLINDDTMSDDTTNNNITTTTNMTNGTFMDSKEVSVDVSQLVIRPPEAPFTFVDVPNQYLCPITKLIMHTPVKNMYDKIYEKESIEQWWRTLQAKQQQLTDPLTNQVVADKSLVEDVELKNEIQEFLNNHPQLRFSVNETYFPKQIIREMKTAIDTSDLEKVKSLVAQFPANFFIQTKFPVPQNSTGSKTSSRNDKETSVSIFDCLYRKIKNFYDSKNGKENPLTENDFMQDPIINFVITQYRILEEYCITMQKTCKTQGEATEYKMMETQIHDGLKNIFVNSVRLFPSTSIIDWLMSLGAKLNSTNQFKQNAFHMACMTDQLSIAQYLHKLSAERGTNIVEERLSDEVKKKWNAFYLAIWHNSYSVIDWIVEDPQLSSRFIAKKHKCLVKDKSSIYHPMNALSLAAYKRNIKLMDTLITNFKYEVPDDKFHPIYWSCIANDASGFKWICECIITRTPGGADSLRHQLKAVNERAFKRSLIHAIAMEASDEMMEFFLEKCKELNILEIVINSQDNFGNTALHYACEKSKTNTIKILIKEGIAHEYINRQGKTASQCCKSESDRDVILMAIKEERDMMKMVVGRVKDLEDDVAFLKRKIMEMEESNKRSKQ